VGLSSAQWKLDGGAKVLPSRPRRGGRPVLGLRHFSLAAVVVISVWLLAPPAALAWDYEGHRAVNQLALAALPDDFPKFTRTPEAQERIAFLSGEPDRWRNAWDLPLRNGNGPDHYFDLEELELCHIEPRALTHFRYEFAAQLAVARATRPSAFAPIDPLRNTDHTRELIGFLPWTITEYYAKVKSAFSYLKEYAADGTPEEVANAEANVIYLMGVMGHFVGDAGQPLHTTKHFNGWVGENPNGYTTNRTIHAWIDGGFFQKAGLDLAALKAKVTPAHLVWPGDSQIRHEDVFPVALGFIAQQQTKVEPLYRLEKEGKLTGEGPLVVDGREFLNEQLLASSQLLANLWLTAWKQAPPDLYLKTQLEKRKQSHGGDAKP